jgi:hypothetical protein
MALDPVFRRSIPVLFVLLATLSPAPAAAMTVHEAKCRAQLSDAYLNVVKYGARSVWRCHDRRDKGVLPASTNCNDVTTADSLTGGYLVAAEARFDIVLNAHCKDVPAVLAEFVRCPAAGRMTDDEEATNGIDSFDELSQCLSVQLRDVLGRAADHILGLPAVPLERDARRCHVTLAKYSAKVIATTFRSRSEYQVATDEAGGPVSFAYATADPEEAISRAIERAADKLESRCGLYAAAMDSCADTASGIADCAIRERAAQAGGGLTSMAWELPGTCPGGIRLRFDYDADGNDVDTGWTGHNHDSAPIGDYDAAQYTITCDSDCENCTGSSPFVPADHCRCDDDASVHCSEDADCAGFGEACTCYFAPPTHVTASGAPYCTLTPIESPMAGVVNMATGEASLDVELRQRIGYGVEMTRVCPGCTDGLCDGGARDGLACSVDAVDDSFGATSFDCPPTPGSNLTGLGTPVRLALSTGSTSLGFDLPCDAPLDGLSCACSTCSLDNQIACNSDAECASYGAGVCRTDGLHLGESRAPNSCSDQICTADSPTDGKCANDPDDLFCDGFVEANGTGVIACGTNADCEILDGSCGGVDGDCGACTVAQPRSCFLDPIVASGSSLDSTMAGAGCMPPTSKPSLNGAYGIPGPYRIVQAFSLHRPMCSNGVTPFEEPGGSNCP